MGGLALSDAEAAKPVSGLYADLGIMPPGLDYFAAWLACACSCLANFADGDRLETETHTPRRR